MSILRTRAADCFFAQQRSTAPPTDRLAGPHSTFHGSTNVPLLGRGRGGGQAAKCSSARQNSILHTRAADCSFRPTALPVLTRPSTAPPTSLSLDVVEEVAKPRGAPPLAKTPSSIQWPPTANARLLRRPTALPVLTRPSTAPPTSITLDVVEELAKPRTAPPLAKSPVSEFVGRRRTHLQKRERTPKRLDV
jgi:hypothetical protein